MKIFTSRLGRIFVVFLIYLAHLGAIYAIPLYFRSRGILISTAFVISLLVLCFSGIIGWLIAADDFREAFVRYKKTEGDKEPSSEFTVFAPLRFLLAVIMWPYLMLFGGETENN
jgi:hypothetical protein